MKKNFRIRKASSFFKAAALVSLFPMMAMADGAAEPKLPEEVKVEKKTNFFTKSDLSGGLFLFGRNRDRIDARTPDSLWNDNLDHISTMASMGIKSRDYLGILSYEVAGFAVFDMYNGDPTVVNQENEFSFAAKHWGDNYKSSGSEDYFTYDNLQQYDEWVDTARYYNSFTDTQLDSIALDRGYTAEQADSLKKISSMDKVIQNKKYEPYNGASVYRAVGTLKIPFLGLTLQGGLGQFGVEGVIGNNWSYFPGAYTGGKADVAIGDKLSLTYAIMNKYKAPWFQSTTGFSKHNAWSGAAFDEKNKIDYLQGGSIKFKINDNHVLTASVGNSEGYMMNYFGKYGAHLDVAGGMDLSYQLYVSDIYDEDSKGLYEGYAQYHAATFALNANLWNFRLEGTHTIAEGTLGNYLPRLTRGYANSQGGFQIWWDMRSDWNENGETALFLNVSRKLDDLLGVPGWTLGAGGAYGFGAEYAPSDLEDGKESAWKVDVSYTTDVGRFKGATFAIHYMQYTNHQSELGDWAFPNMFQSERDFMVKAILPFGMKL